MIRLPGKPLPKKILRPFEYESYGIDEKEYKFLSSVDTVIIFSALKIICYLIIVGAFIGWLAQDFDSKIEPFVILSALFCIICLKIYLSMIKPSRFIIFNRKNGQVFFPVGISGKKKFIYDWVDLEARIITGGSYVGAVRKKLMLTHLPTRKIFEVDSSLAGIDTLLGEWSFIVQYMDRKGPYPNIPELNSQKDLTDGLGTWEEWDKTKQKLDKDPYYSWLENLKKNPDLDLVNKGVY